MDYFVGTFVFLLGLLIGSFLNVCIYRIPNGKSIVTPPSSCTNCGNRIKWYDLFPVVSYLALGRKCRHCGQKISPRYMFIELLTGVLFLVCFLVFGFTFQMLAYLVLTAILITITFIDIDEQIIPDPIMIFGLIVGIAFVLLRFVPELDAPLKQNIISGLLGMVCGAGPLIIINLLSLAIIKRAGIGGGDIKLMGVVGLFLGMENILLALVLGIVIAGLFSIFYLRRKRQDETEKAEGTQEVEGTEEEKKGPNLHEIPFGPYLAIGCFVSMLYGQQIINWYFSLF